MSGPNKVVFLYSETGVHSRQDCHTLHSSLVLALVCLVVALLMVYQFKVTVLTLSWLSKNKKWSDNGARY